MSSSTLLALLITLGDPAHLHGLIKVMRVGQLSATRVITVATTTPTTTVNTALALLGIRVVVGVAQVVGEVPLVDRLPLDRLDRRPDLQEGCPTFLPLLDLGGMGHLARHHRRSRVTPMALPVEDLER